MTIYKHYLPNTMVLEVCLRLNPSIIESSIISLILSFTAIFDWLNRLMHPTLSVRMQLLSNGDMATRIFLPPMAITLSY